MSKKWRDRMKRKVVPKDYKRIELLYQYDHRPVLRRSAMSRKAWDYICHKFSVTQVDSDKVASITIEGEDDYGRLMVSAMIEDEPPTYDDDEYDDAIWYN